MAYELTRYGEEKLETLPTEIETRREKLRPRGSKSPYDSTFYKMTRQLFLLGQVRWGNEPLQDAFDFMKEGPRKVRASSGLRKELDHMLKVGLVREVK